LELERKGFKTKELEKNYGLKASCIACLFIFSGKIYFIFHLLQGCEAIQVGKSKKILSNLILLISFFQQFSILYSAFSWF